MVTKLKIRKYETDTYIYFECPGCKQVHAIRTPDWEWNGSVESPTFSPSILANGHDQTKRCHSFVKDGKIQYLNDCFHEMRGTTVELPAWSNYENFKDEK